MSQTLVNDPAADAMPNLSPDEANKRSRHRGERPISPWAVAAVTCTLLAISYGYRYSRDSQFRGLAEQSKRSPFPLSDLPMTLGTWIAVPNSDGQLDPEIARLAGSSDHLIRAYSDSATREVATVLVLYGLADSVFGHTPEICYAAGGFQPVTAPSDREFSLSDSSTPVRYRGFYVSKSSVGTTDYFEVVWSFWHAGSWWPDVASRWKQFRSSPAMFKVQIQRQASGLSLERFSCEPLLQELVREIDARIALAKTIDDKKQQRP